MTNSFLKIAALAGLTLSLFSTARAISLTPASPYVAHVVSAANPNLSAYGDVLYKSTQADGSESGAFADFYTTTYGTLAPASAVISWNGPAFIDSNPVYALIKDGNLGWYFYDITGWNGKDDISFSGYFGGNQGKISHVSIIGKSTPHVPDSGMTAVLLAFGLTALSFFARRRSA